MTIPAGISTALVHMDAPVSFIGEPGRLYVRIQPSASLVWEETGTPLANFFDAVSPDNGLPMEIELPHTDQDGFIDGLGNSITGWFYTVTIKYEKDGQIVHFPSRDFQIPVGQTDVDLALVPSGDAFVPQVAPILPVTSIEGLNGEVTLAELGIPGMLDLKMNKGELVINPRDYGVIGDGVADDTAAIQALFDSLTPGIVVQFPPGTYKHDKLVITNKSRFTILAHSARFLAQTRTDRYFRLIGCADFSIRGLDSSGSFTGQGGYPTRALSIEDSTRFEVEGCYLHDSEGPGILMQNSTHGRILGNLIVRSAKDGIHMTRGCRHISVVNNIIEQSGDDCIAVVSYNSDAAPCEDITITSNEAWHSLSRGIVVVGGNNVSIAGNTIREPRNGGIYIAMEGPTSYDTRRVSNVSITGNTILGANTYGQTLTYAAIHIVGNGAGREVDGITISGNTIADSNWHGMLIGSGSAGVYNVNVTGNTVRNSGSTGIYVQVVTDIIISSNLTETSKTEGIATIGSLGLLAIMGNTIADAYKDSVASSRRAIFASSPALSRGSVAGNVILDRINNLTVGVDYGSATNLTAYGNTSDKIHGSFAIASNQPFIVPGSALLAGAQLTSGLGGGLGVVGIRNANTAPSSNPTSGGILYVVDGVPVWRTSGGSVAKLAGNMTAVTADYAALSSDSLLLVTGGTTGVTVTLPAGVKGARYTIKKTDSGVGAVTVATTSGQLIDGATTYRLDTRYDTLTVEYGTSAWYVVDRVNRVLTSANGTRYLLGVADDGALTTTSL
jgi:hypothetical protein